MMHGQRNVKLIGQCSGDQTQLHLFQLYTQERKKLIL